VAVAGRKAVQHEFLDMDLHRAASLPSVRELWCDLHEPFSMF
jgi:hypothetical protein